MGSTVAADTFLLLSGLLTSYGALLSRMREQNLYIFKFYLHRFVRLMPLLSLMVVTYTTILKHLGSGPIWNMQVDPLFQSCQNYWWSTLLNIQNYINPSEMCIPETWYVAVIIQLHLLSPIILIPLVKYPTIGITFAGILIICSITSSFVVGWIYDLYGFPVINFMKGTSDNYLSHYYFATHTRATPYFFGIILGYIIFEVKHNHKQIYISKFTSLLLWIISITALNACLFMFTITTYECYNKFANSIHLALLRPGWALGVSWVVLACVIERGGSVNWFLSLPVFQIISKLTYGMYLTNRTMIIVISAQTRTLPYLNNFGMLYGFWGDFAYSFGISIIATLGFEMPIRVLIEEFIFSNRGKKVIRTKKICEIDTTTII
ncbi:hypothetical protein ILUMI_24241 [Ignelater luminosus]|uniref:Acyltransferase 3 domain-containing protein n=1 Tax=Ignelater luminosus TaxID=2038154 RepID=A0A8K0G0U7_IGNLU|nr:hypothetical protein ILUMI_24241 [Ignelater luminosus]